MKENNLVITGMGAVTPVGIGVSEYWNALKEGTCGVGKITRFAAGEMPVQIAAELKDFDPTAYMPKTLARTMDPFMQFAFIAAEQAIGQRSVHRERVRPCRHRHGYRDGRRYHRCADAGCLR